jgi:hypothetical protein
MADHLTQHQRQRLESLLLIRVVGQTCLHRPERPANNDAVAARISSSGASTSPTSPPDDCSEPAADGG